MITADPILPVIVGICFVVIVIGIISKKLKQPYVIAYIIAGVILGKSGLDLLSDGDLVSSLSAIGVTILLFFIGMEIDIKKLVSNWKVAIIGTLFQILISILVIWGFGTFFDWGYQRIIFLGFVVSLSSTAVVLKLLEEWNETNTKQGQNVISILITQDFAIIPMLIVIGLMGNQGINYSEITLQFIGMIIMFSIITYIIIKKEISIPFISKIKEDPEIQVFSALFICFGLALLSGLFNLSTALGAFLGGIIISASKNMDWVHDSLRSFKSFFVSLFFISIGLLIDLSFLFENLITVIGIVIIVYVTNTFINSFILILLKNNWRDSLYAGSLLGQIGEFSFLLVAIGLQVGIITNFSYQITIEVIALTLLLSPLWISFIKKIIVNIDRFSYKIP